jgi:hypothetical protein
MLARLKATTDASHVSALRQAEADALTLTDKYLQLEQLQARASVCS